MDRPGNERLMHKAVVLAAGIGSRMRRRDDRALLDPDQAAAADTGVKAMIPFPRPFLDYVLSALADVGIQEVCIVVSSGDRSIRKHYAAVTPRRIRVCFAVQPEPRGTADAVLAAEAFASTQDFLLLNSDNYYPVAAYRAMRELDGAGLPVFSRQSLVAKGNIAPERVNRYAVVHVDSAGFLLRIEEKPDAAAVAAMGDRVLVSMNLWRFSPQIFEACRRVPVSARGERELPQAVDWAVRELRQKFRAIPCDEGVLDLSARSDVATVARRLRHVEVRL
jgi:glucose-1-phosphate thymidylyltransferase